MVWHGQVEVSWVVGGSLSYPQSPHGEDRTQKFPCVGNASMDPSWIGS